MFTAAGKSAAVSAANYIEDVFSTYLYTGNSSTQTITNGIDLSTKGGLVWIKGRNQAYNNNLFDTARGTQNRLNSNTTGAAVPAAGGVTSFNTNGFTLDSGAGYNDSPNTFASWTFREQAKFFDVVTYTGNGSTQNISHNLGSEPGCVIIKSTTAAEPWVVWHRELSFGYTLLLNTTAAQSGPFNNVFGNNSSVVPPSTTQVTVGNSTRVNQNGQGYVMYVFAHNSGGFGATGSDNVISCGSFTTDGGSSFTAVNLGYEPQWLLIKASSGTSNWTIVDNMRGIPVGSNGARLIANLSDAETSTFSWANLTATGFSMPTGGTNPYSPSTTYIYIAIRRGPMKTPTSGTSVFNTVFSAASGNPAFVAGFPVDFGTWKFRNLNASWNNSQRLTSGTYQEFNTTAAEASYSDFRFDFQNGWASAGQGSGTNLYSYCFRRAPGFFDVVCYTGNGSARTISHNLGVAPELLIVKSRDTAVNWVVWASAPTPQQNQYALNLNTAGTWGGVLGDDIWGATLTGAPNMTSTTFSLGSYVGVNGSAKTYVAYLFASCPGVSKVGSYTGTGALQTINCGFAAGARFVLIKRTDSTGDWWVYDSARGITSGNDPYLFLNSSAAEVTNTNYVDTASTGFQVTAAAPAGLNANGGTYIFLAIA